MKARRGKSAYKILIHFKHNYKIHAPYRILVDGSFCNAALQNKINLREQIPKYLDAETEIVTTKCVLAEMEAIGSAVHGAAVVCKQFHVDDCPHKHPVAARECLIKLAKRARRDGATKYIIGTQDEVLKEKLRKLLSVPILFIAFNAVLFDKLTTEAKDAVSGDKADLERLTELRKEILGEVGPEVKKKRKIKGKNPLSCRKKIVKSSQQPQPQASGARTAAGKRRRRKKEGQETTESQPEPAESS